MNNFDDEDNYDEAFDDIPQDNPEQITEYKNNDPVVTDCIIDNNNNKYFIEKVIGEGGGGIVYKCKTEKGDYCAIKFGGKNLDHEGRLGAGEINWNNNILASEDGYAIDAACYLNNRNFLPNLIENKSSPLTGRILKFRALDDSLQNLLEKSITPEGRIVLEENIFTVVNDIKKAIYFSNAQLGLIHCDVSPDNILIKYKNGASKKIEKVLLHDFGCAKKSEELENGEGRGGKFLYYLPYIPEKHVDYQIDTYAFGVVILQLLTRTANLILDFGIDTRDSGVMHWQNNQRTYLEKLAQLKDDKYADVLELCRKMLSLELKLEDLNPESDNRAIQVQTKHEEKKDEKEENNSQSAKTIYNITNIIVSKPEDVDFDKLNILKKTNKIGNFFKQRVQEEKLADTQVLNLNSKPDKETIKTKSYPAVTKQPVFKWFRGKIFKCAICGNKIDASKEWNQYQAVLVCNKFYHLSCLKEYPQIKDQEIIEEKNDKNLNLLKKIASGCKKVYYSVCLKKQSEIKEKSQEDAHKNKWKILAQLGKNNFGEFFLTFSNNKAVVLHCFPPNKSKNKDSSAWKRMMNRYDRANDLLMENLKDHVINFSKIKKGNKAGKECYFYTMSYEPVLTLKEVVDGMTKSKKKKRLEFKKALPILFRLANLLQILHSKRLIHRDIKPSHILCHKDGSIFLSGFCLLKRYKLFGKDKLEYGCSTDSVTAEISYNSLTGNNNPDQSCVNFTCDHSFIGTPAYAAPEQIWNAVSVKDKADIWAWSVVAFKLLAGYSPFNQQKNIYNSLSSVRKFESFGSYAHKLPRDVPKEMVDIFYYTMAKNPGKRITAEKLLELLSNLL